MGDWWDGEEGDERRLVVREECEGKLAVEVEWGGKAGDGGVQGRPTF
jgi:hypothetical protein